MSGIGLTTLVIDGGTTPSMTNAADALAAAMPEGLRTTIDGQPHNVADDAISTVLAAFFGGVS